MNDNSILFLRSTLCLEPSQLSRVYRCQSAYSAQKLTRADNSKFYDSWQLDKCLIFNQVFYPHQNPLFSLVVGGALFGIVYMTTDPVSQAKGKLAIWIYGALIGFLTVFIRKYSLFYEGMMFAILMVNAFMPMIEYGLDKITSKKPKAVKA